MKSWHPLILLAPLAILALAVVGFLALDTGPAHAPDEERGAFRGCTAEETATQTAYEALPTPTPFGYEITSDDLNRLSREQAGTPFVGSLCDFLVVASAEQESQALADCPGNRTVIGGPDASSPVFVESELNGAEVWTQILCDGTPIIAYGPDGRRAYYREETTVFARNASRQHLSVVDIQGHPALIILPPIQLGTWFFHVIERLPSSSAPGILLTGGMAHSLDDALQKATNALNHRPLSPTRPDRTP